MRSNIPITSVAACTSLMPEPSGPTLDRMSDRTNRTRVNALVPTALAPAAKALPNRTDVHSQPNMNSKVFAACILGALLLVAVQPQMTKAQGGCSWLMG